METEESKPILNEALYAPRTNEKSPDDETYHQGGENAPEVANLKPGEALRVEGIMPWMPQREIGEMEHVQKIRNAIVANEGLMTPEANQRALGYVTHYYERATERAAKAKAMTDEYFSKLLLDDPDLSIGRAKVIAQGSEFGQKHTYYKNQAEGYKEILQSMKKNIAYYEGRARNQW